MSEALPPGQRSRADFPRFGLPKFADRRPTDPDRIRLAIAGDACEPFELGEEHLASLARHEQVSDFHCVTTWSYTGCSWSGWKLSDLYEELLAPRLSGSGARLVGFRCQDGYRTSLLLEDALAADVLLADRLNGEPLGVEHGAPLRLVAPAHYGYKNAKHLKGLEFYVDEAPHLHGGLAFMDHPRARVAFEERAQVLPKRIARLLYRLGIESTVRRFRL